MFLETMSIIFSLLIISFLIIGVLWCRNNEYKTWNHGKCDTCGEKWFSCGMNSQGGRLYSCKNGHYCMITYNVDK